MGRLLQLAGVVYLIGSCLHFFSAWGEEGRKLNSVGQGSTFEQQFNAGYQAGEAGLSLIGWQFVHGAVAGMLIALGNAIDRSEKNESTTDSADNESGPAEEENLDYSWRKNPFKRGEVSETVLPRGEFHKKRNKFRKTIERPNSDGY